MANLSLSPDPAETGLKDQITVLKARPGHQITALNINQGRLLSITQVRWWEFRSPWFPMSTDKPMT